MNAVARLFSVTLAMVAAMLVFVPGAAAADFDFDEGNGMIIVIGHDLNLPAGSHNGAVVVINGSLTLAGDADNVVVINGTATLTGAHVASFTGLRSSATLNEGTVVGGDVRVISGSFQRNGNVQVLGTLDTSGKEWNVAPLVLGPAMALLWLSFALAAVFGAVLLVGLASRQVRRAEDLISQSPGTTFLAGLLAFILLPTIAVLIGITLIGLPIGLIVLTAFSILLFVGYLVAAIWLGDFLIRRFSPGADGERPYRAAIVGVVALATLGIIPAISGIAALVGFGAACRLLWQVFRGSRSATAPAGSPAMAGASNA